MPLQHFARVGIHQSINFQMRRVIFKHLQYGGRQQHIAMMAQLRHQHSFDIVQMYSVFNHAAKIAEVDGLCEYAGGYGKNIQN